MPPKARVTREMIVAAAFELVRKQGLGALNARSVAAALDSSTQPVFSNFSSMEEVKAAVIEAADEFFASYAQDEIQKGKYPAYKASGMAYIRFAKEERELFKLLYMRDRSREEDLRQDRTEDSQAVLVKDSTGFEGDTARLFHLEMWAFVHGIAVITASNYADFDEQLISAMLTDAFQGLRKRHAMG